MDIRALSLTDAGGKGPEVRFEVETPTGVTATPASGTVVDGTQRITLSARPGAEQGFSTARIKVTSTGTAYEQPIALTVAAPGSLLAAYNNTGTSDDTGDHTEADYDGGGWSYSRQALAAAGLSPGGRGTLPSGLAFTWPTSPTGRPDNASATAQTIELPAPAAQLSFIGSAVFGNQQTQATVTYTDGTTDTVDLALTDWTLGGGGTGTVQYGNEVVARTTYRNVAGGGRDPVPTYVFATRPFQAPAGRSIASVRLPDNANVHVFALALDRGPATGAHSP